MSTASEITTAFSPGAKSGKYPNNPKAVEEAKAALKGDILAGFDYSQIADQGIRTKARKTAAVIKNNIRDIEKAMLDNGRKLLAIKDDLGHGHFVSWIEAEFQWSIRTAQNYMAVAERLGDDYLEVAYLPSQITYRLVAKSTPEKLITEVVAAAKNGKPMTDDQVSTAIASAKAKYMLSSPKQAEQNADTISNGAEPNEEASSDANSGDKNAREKAATELLQLFAADQLAAFLRLAPLAGLTLSPEFQAVAKLSANLETAA